MGTAYTTGGYVSLGYVELTTPYVLDGYVSVGYSEGLTSESTCTPLNYVADGYTDGYVEYTKPYFEDGYAEAGYSEGCTLPVICTPLNYMAEGYSDGYVEYTKPYFEDGYAEAGYSEGCIPLVVCTPLNYVADGYTTEGYVEALAPYFEEGYSDGYVEGCYEVDLIESINILIEPSTLTLTLFVHDSNIQSDVKVSLGLQNITLDLLFDENVNVIIDNCLDYKRVISIGGVVLDYPMFITNEYNTNKYIGVEELSVQGGLNKFVQEQGITAKTPQVYSGDSAWLTYSTIKEINNLNPYIAHEVLYSDTTTDSCFFNHNKIPLEKEPIYLGSIWYNVEINLIIAD